MTRRSNLIPPTGRQLLGWRFTSTKFAGVVSRYASELFEIAVAFGAREGLGEYPVIVIPKGVRSPVAAKADLSDVSGRKLVRYGDVYSPHPCLETAPPSTALARPEDWRAIVEICFNNREADFGQIPCAVSSRGATRPLFWRR